MANFSNTRDALIERILKTIMEPWSWYEGEADASAVGTLVDATRYERDDFFQNKDAWAYIRTTTDGLAPIGETREISDWVQGGGTATVVPNWTAAPGVGDTYAIIVEYMWSEVVGAINAAIDDARDEGIYLEKIDHSVELAADVYEYTIPAGFTHIYRVTMPNSSGQHLDPINPMHWSIVRGTDTPRLKLHVFPDSGKHDGHYYGGLWADTGIVAGRTLRIEGLQTQAQLDNDTDICKISPDYVCHKAAYYLHSRRIKRAETDPDEHATQAARCLSRATAALRNSRTQMPASSRRVEL